MSVHVDPATAHAIAGAMTMGTRANPVTAYAKGGSTEGGITFEADARELQATEQRLDNLAGPLSQATKHHKPHAGSQTATQRSAAGEQQFINMILRTGVDKAITKRGHGNARGGNQQLKRQIKAAQEQTRLKDSPKTAVKPLTMAMLPPQQQQKELEEAERHGKEKPQGLTIQLKNATTATTQPSATSNSPNGRRAQNKATRNKARTPTTSQTASAFKPWDDVGALMGGSYVDLDHKLRIKQV